MSHMDFTVKGVSDRDMDVRITSVTPNELYRVDCQCVCGVWNEYPGGLKTRDITGPKNFMFQCQCGAEYGFSLAPVQKGSAEPVAYIR